jgi:hypothetical protein
MRKGCAMGASRRRGRRALAEPLSVLAFVLALSSTAAAQDDATEQARALFNDGLAFAEHSDWERAAQRFRAALELRESANIRFNLAQSLAHMGRLLEALEESARVLEDESADQQVRNAAGALSASIRPRLGLLVVEVRGDAADTQVTVDGRPLLPEQIGVALPSDPGVRIARLLRGAIELDMAEVDVPRGRQAHVLVEAPASAASVPESGWDDGWTWAIAISSVVVVAAAAIVIGFAVADPMLNGSSGDFGPPTLEIE